MIVSHDSSVPLYMQVYNYVLEQIESGQYQNGDKIPSQESLVKLCGVSLVTVRKGLEQLAADGIITTKQGTGSFVTHTGVPIQIFAGHSFTDTCHKIGCEPRTKIIDITHESAGHRVAVSLGVAVGEEVLRIQRLRLMDDKECILENDYFTARYEGLKDELRENHSLLDVLAHKYDQREFQFDDFFDIAYATPEQAKLLDCLTSMPLLRVSEIIRTPAREVLYYNEQFIRADRYRYAIVSHGSRD